MWEKNLPIHWTSLVAQWLRICLPMQRTRFDPWSGKIPHASEQLSPCATATEPPCYNYWSPCAATTEARVPRARAPQQKEATAMRSPCTAMKSSSRSPQLEKARVQQQRPSTAKKKKKKIKIKKWKIKYLKEYIKKKKSKLSKTTARKWERSGFEYS